MRKSIKEEELEQKQNEFCDGDNEAFAFLFELWKTELFFYTFHYLKNDKETEDVLYDCFEKILMTKVDYRVEKFITEGLKLKPFLKVVLKNKALDLIKTKKNRSRITKNITSLINRVSYNGSLVQENEDFLFQLVKHLKKRDKEMLLLHLQGYSIEEIGYHFFLTKKTVSNILTNCKNDLRRQWKKSNEI
ncbi:RNA polymerase sigma factor [Psychroflexus salis]|uniref:RNA polymerase sigma factor, sigma-70 family n=1 Tax=Psychroflexus salis TaxID=1526574 RepID=A0A917EAS0_9FLAO|nr:sigma-70 family RNA polymerase sigma factor [Psychroflexus salis]GGE15757.1 hypothetical protein GCM10010831_16340 [Psychroflexus salis]